MIITKLQRDASGELETRVLMSLENTKTGEKPLDETDDDYTQGTIILENIKSGTYIIRPKLASDAKKASFSQRVTTRYYEAKHVTIIIRRGKNRKRGEKRRTKVSNWVTVKDDWLETTEERRAYRRKFKSGMNDHESVQ